MGHLHSVYDTDNHFKVNGITRVITDVSKSKTSVVQGDHNSERFTFEIPRYIEGHDMATCNSVSVRYQNGTAKDGMCKGKYIVGDFQISPADDNVVICSWLISKRATQYAGSLKFYLRLECISGTEPDYTWSTAMYTGITVQPSFDDFDVVEEGDYVEYPDEPDVPVVEKLAAPTIRLETVADEEVENTPAILGVAVLGRTILGDTGGTILKLNAPTIKLEVVEDEGEELPQLDTPTIQLETVTDENDSGEEEITPTLAAPEIELVTVTMVLATPEIELVGG